MPKTNYHLLSENPAERRFLGKAPIKFVTALFFFRKGSSFRKVLHELKYNGRKDVGVILGKYAAFDLLHIPAIASVDYIVPIPLHPKKLKKRTYNQSEQIAIGLSSVLGTQIDTKNLIRIHNNTSQTSKSASERYKNTEGIFRTIDKEFFKHKHILLVDDVLTTGATLEACIKALLQTENITISIFTLAVTE
ncbi:MAG: ComF family protein [Prevotellaceae bacterium]|jgi:ComF family protein|nr:ComF family protein [Prevotellaceae bacterium]